jgi:hypothetical protein
MSLALSGLPSFPDACSQLQAAPPKPELPFQVNIVILGDDAKPVADASLLSGKKVVAKTKEDGKTKLSFTGQEGSMVSLTVKCPDGFSSPSKPMEIGLRHLDPGSPAPRYEGRCIRQSHSILVGLRTQNGANLPILRLGQVIGKTDQYGEAQLLLQTIPNEPVSLKLDTSANDTLRPQSPNLTFMSRDKDELVLLEQKFIVKKKVIHVYKPPIPINLNQQ